MCGHKGFMGQIMHFFKVNYELYYIIDYCII